jgi:hypothetical protein
MSAEGVIVRVPLATQLFRFICTGVVGAVVDFGSTYLLSLAGLSHGGSKTVGFVLGTLTAYLINLGMCSLTALFTACATTLFTPCLTRLLTPCLATLLTESGADEPR